MKTVLLVHDRQENPWERKQQIEASGFAVELASRAEECLHRLEYGLPDLVLLDVLLEGENGFSLCRRLRERYSAQQLPIVLTATAFSEPRYFTESRDAGAQEYLIRPIPVSSLVRILHRLTSGPRTATAPATASATAPAATPVSASGATSGSTPASAPAEAPEMPPAVF